MTASTNEQVRPRATRSSGAPLGGTDDQDWDERPWGTWRVLDAGPGYKVKRIEVSAGHRLSYQVHQHRAEHWLVVAGVATCVIDDATVVAHPGEHLFVGQGVPHRIGNNHELPLVIIETQRGSYTGEDDIVRLADDYDRCDTR